MTRTIGITARQASARAAKARKKLERDAVAAAEALKKKAAERLEWAKRELLPKYWADIQEKISESVAAGGCLTTYHIPHGREPELAAILAQRLEAAGYQVQWEATTSMMRMSDETPEQPVGSTDFRITW